MTALVIEPHGPGWFSHSLSTGRCGTVDQPDMKRSFVLRWFVTAAAALVLLSPPARASHIAPGRYLDAQPGVERGPA